MTIFVATFSSKNFSLLGTLTIQINIDISQSTILRSKFRYRLQIFQNNLEVKF